MASDEPPDDEVAQAVREGRANIADPDLAILTKIHQIHAIVMEMARIYQHRIKAVQDKQVHEKGVINTIALAGHFKIFKQALDELHHSVGHALFDTCWQNVEMGEEFETTSELSLAEVLAGGAGVGPLVVGMARAVAEELGDQGVKRGSGPMPEIH